MVEDPSRNCRLEGGSYNVRREVTAEGGSSRDKAAATT